jgi:hypothetical protein
MTSGAIQQGVPTKVCRDLARERSPPAASHADTPKSAIWIWPSVPRRMLPAYNRAAAEFTAAEKLMIDCGFDSLRTIACM